jgi:hypothetical protein
MGGGCLLKAGAESDAVNGCQMMGEGLTEDKPTTAPNLSSP